jgi:hypothetical protein
LAIAGATPPATSAGWCWRSWAGIAKFERELIRKRCQAGIERAKANGKQLGRPLDAK